MYIDIIVINLKLLGQLLDIVKREEIIWAVNLRLNVTLKCVH